MIFVAACGFGFGFLAGVIAAADYLEKECNCEHTKD